ncbi:flotillin-like FloA family protein [Desulfonema magnum]|uniref:UPF0365 n=1 Tax=Desulfonema magnum TaxID=45655 RepID=A0A975BVX1_9BACT|nr:flotillin-like FloA family protein [Desulfonema magnum]QTA92704.1 UPF0365 [Desulfonema magnum]
MEKYKILIVAVSALIFIIGAFLYVYHSKSLWIKSFLLGVPVNPFRLILMSLRDIDPKMILELKIKAAKSGVKITTSKLESHMLAGADVKLILDATIKAEQAGVKINTDFLKSHQLSGGDVNLIVESKIQADKVGLDIDIAKLGGHNLSHGNIPLVIEAMTMANNADIPLDFERAAAIDLTGRDILEAVKTQIRPVVIQTERVTAVAKDGVELTAIARVLIRMNLDRVVGGGGKDSILARVGEGIVAAIGSANSYEEFQENISNTSHNILESFLVPEVAENLAFDVVDINIEDVDVGENVGAKHEAERAETNKKIAESEAEKKKKDMEIRLIEMKVRIREKEADVQEAMAEAFRKGTMGVMDYYRMKSVKADTDMRRSFALSGKSDENESEES